jgi:hypothetical protein
MILKEKGSGSGSSSCPPRGGNVVISSAPCFFNDNDNNNISPRPMVLVGVTFFLWLKNHFFPSLLLKILTS